MFFRKLVVGASAFLASLASASASASAAQSQCDTTPEHVKFGSSTLGTLQQKPLPRFLTNNPLPGGFPWGKRDCKNDQPKSPPHTGVTRYYDFTLSRGKAAPDGFLKDVIYINNQFPGPLIEANWGDWIQVTVNNNLTAPEEGTSVHWHGMLQKETPWMDGTPTITQCPIAPGASFTYRFRADTYGSSWYHSHYSAQYIDGSYGPMVIYGPTHADFDEDLGIVMIQDYYHRPYFPILQDVMSSNATRQVQFSDSALINGRMPFNCSLAAPGSVCTSDADFSKFRVQVGKTYKLRLVNPGAGSVEYFSIDNHELTVIGNDFVDVVPYKTNIVTLGVGQRSDVLFTPKGNGAVWMRTESSGRFCGGARSLNPKAKAIILLDNAPEDTIPTTPGTPPPFDNGLCANDPLNKTIPYYPMKLPSPSVTYNIIVNQIVNATGQKLFIMNGSPFQGNYNDPVLLRAEEKDLSFSPNYNVVNFGTNSSIRINVWNNNSSPHPMHLHGHDFYVLHDGPGQWDGVSIVNPSNPQRRDTHNLAPFGHVVIQYDSDNPGAWPFHCHIGWHLSQGLFMTFLERPADIAQKQIPMVMAKTCTDWDAYTSKTVVDQIDSGLKKRERMVRRKF